MLRKAEGNIFRSREYSRMTSKVRRVLLREAAMSPGFLVPICRAGCTSDCRDSLVSTKRRERTDEGGKNSTSAKSVQQSTLLSLRGEKIIPFVQTPFLVEMTVLVEYGLSMTYNRVIEQRTSAYVGHGRSEMVIACVWMDTKVK